VQINHTEGKQQIQYYSNSTVLRLVPYSSYYLPRVNNDSANNISILNVWKYLDELWKLPVTTYAEIIQYFEASNCTQISVKQISHFLKQAERNWSLILPTLNDI
jgi:hypothetical protein